MIERYAEQPNEALTHTQLARKGADLFIDASYAVPSSPACQGAYIALECQRRGLDVLLVGGYLLVDDDAQDRVVRAANAVHARHPGVAEKIQKVHKMPEVTRDLAHGFIESAYTFASTLSFASASELERLVGMHPGKGKTNYEGEARLQREARSISRRARTQRV